MPAPTDNLSRARATLDAAAIRSTDDDEAGVLFGHFSVFDNWYEVNSVWEGRFLERIRPGAFERTLSERGSQIKALYDHGADPHLGNKPLGRFTRLEEDEVGGVYEIDLIDTDYNRDFIKPAARAGLLGSSFRFKVVNEDWVDHPKRSDHNPERLPERSILDTDVFELGPVTFPANEAADAALRSTSDEFFDRLLNDPLFVARFTERVGVGVAEKVITSLPPDGRSTLKQTADGLRTEGTAGRDPHVLLRQVQAMRLGRSA